MKKVVVLSLGGSLIVPQEIDWKFLKSFKEILLHNSRHFKFVVVCGGGSIARVYIRGLEHLQLKNKQYFQNNLGISTTRLNARFMTYFFGKDANKGIPHDIIDVEIKAVFFP